MKIILMKEGENIGNLVIIKDYIGGGLNGGVFFQENNSNVLEKAIPLFDDFNYNKHRNL